MSENNPDDLSLTIVEFIEHYLPEAALILGVIGQALVDSMDQF